MLKRIRNGFMAMVLGVAMAITMPVSAEETADVTRAVVGVNCSSCGAYTTNITRRYPSYYEQNNDNSHDKKQKVEFTCPNGHVTGVTSILATESHTFNRNRWDSIMHYSSSSVEGGTHTYRIYCTQCSYSRVITIPCNYERLGYHNTPF